MKNELVKSSAEAEKKKIERIELMPPVDIVEGNEAFFMYLEVPGANSSTIRIEAKNGYLHVTAESSLCRNCRKVDFKRSFRLSKAIDCRKISAETKNGILTITLPKSEQVKPFQIPVS